MNKRIAIGLISVLTILLLFIIYHRYFFNSLAIFDDQRNVINELKTIHFSGYDPGFFRAPLFYFIYLIGMKFLPTLILVKYIFLLVIPLFIYFVFNIGVQLTRHQRYSILYSSILTILLLVFYQFWLISGHHKSLTLPLLMGVIYFTITGKNGWAFIILFMIAFIYPPHLIIGLGFLLSYQLLKTYKNWKVNQEPLSGVIKTYSRKFLFPSFIIVGGYAIYFAVAILGTIPTFNANEPVTSARYSNIPQEIVREIENVRPDYIPNHKKVFGIVPEMYLNDIRLGFFGLIGDYQLWTLLILLLLGFVAILGKDFKIPDSAIALYFTGIFLYLMSQLFYPDLYLPNRYTLFTLPLATSILIVLNVTPVARSIVERIKKISSPIINSVSIVLILVSVFIFYFGVWKKEIYFGTEYNNFEFFFFLLISIICIGLVLFASLVRFRNRGNKTPIRTTAISLTIVVIVLIILFTGFPPPIVFHDAKLVHWVNTMPETKKIAGYPEEMDTLGALTQQYFIMNLGQDRTSEDALNFYNFLNAYYAQNYSNVKEYLQSYGMDYLVVNTDYFPPNRSEKNTLFAFYSVLRDHEKQLRAISSQFALQNPSPKLIVLQTADHVIISAKALESALSDSTKFVGFYAK